MGRLSSSLSLLPSQRGNVRVRSIGLTSRVPAMTSRESLPVRKLRARTAEERQSGPRATRTLSLTPHLHSSGKAASRGKADRKYTFLFI